MFSRGSICDFLGGKTRKARRNHSLALRIIPMRNVFFFSSFLSFPLLSFLSFFLLLVCLLHSSPSSLFLLLLFLHATFSSQPRTSLSHSFSPPLPPSPSLLSFPCHRRCETPLSRLPHLSSFPPPLPPSLLFLFYQPRQRPRRRCSCCYCCCLGHDLGDPVVY